jgi:hypothetical protein
MPPRHVIETVLTLRERERDATLRLQLTTPDGSDLGDIEARLHQLYLGEPGSYELELQRDGASRLVRWFPGRYRLEVAPKESGSEFGWFAPFERPVQLRRGETTTVAASVPAGGPRAFPPAHPGAACSRGRRRLRRRDAGSDRASRAAAARVHRDDGGRLEIAAARAGRSAAAVGTRAAARQPRAGDPFARLRGHVGGRRRRRARGDRRARVAAAPR